MADLLERAVEHLMEDESLLGDLADPEAKVLLAWGQREVARLVSTVGEGEGWEALSSQIHDLRKQIRKMARTASEADDPAAALAELTGDAASEAGGESLVASEGVAEVPAEVETDGDTIVAWQEPTEPDADSDAES